MVGIVMIRDIHKEVQRVHIIYENDIVTDIHVRHTCILPMLKSLTNHVVNLKHEHNYV
jgi:predicted type IV restriction endonuclease